MENAKIFAYAVKVPNQIELIKRKLILARSELIG